MQKLKKMLENCYLSLIVLFLYAPILMLMVLSFNSSKSRAHWGGFSLRWYAEMLASEDILLALKNTLLIALISALLATVLGTMAAIAIRNMRALPRNLIMGITNVPMLNADIVTGISLMLCFIAFRISLGFQTILIAHITFNIPYVILSVMPKLRQSSQVSFEAAQDLGAGPVRAFFSVVLPDIMPGVLSGFLLAFTMSLDDFIITHFTRGAGINTISTLVYSEVRRGIKPSMYALSSVIFTTVFVVLLISNFAPEWLEKRRKKEKKSRLSPAFVLCLLLPVLLSLLLPGCGKAGKTEAAAGGAAALREDRRNTLNVYNWGEYIDPEVISLFEEETGIEVVYDMFETNEEMYPVIEAGGVIYDVVCPSDYMVEKMIRNGLLQPLDYSRIPNISEIGEEYSAMAAKFDPGNRYAVPYMCGTVGIIYNKGMLDELGIPYPTRWADLWDERLRGEILMQDSVRDAFMVALKKEGFSMNTTEEAELDRARDELIRQKPLIQAYVIDQVRDKMIGGEAAVGVIYSGEMLYIQDEVSETDMELEYIIPEEGTNLWVDSWVIPANAAHKESAEKWIDFLCRPDIAKLNFEYITYTTPNKGAYALLDPEYTENEALFPDMKRVLEKGEVFNYLGEEDDAKYNDRWKTVKVS